MADDDFTSNEDRMVQVDLAELRLRALLDQEVQRARDEFPDLSAIKADLPETLSKGLDGMDNPPELIAMAVRMFMLDVNPTCTRGLEQGVAEAVEACPACPEFWEVIESNGGSAYTGPWNDELREEGVRDTERQAFERAIKALAARLEQQVGPCGDSQFRPLLGAAMWQAKHILMPYWRAVLANADRICGATGGRLYQRYLTRALSLLGPLQRRALNYELDRPNAPNTVPSEGAPTQP